ncbi:hypothetical protein FB45DRAFT_352672 [Roridomyces roridus]|uniref:Uncharacterized protein n=1 Tax=Roridomyces roridus TaxID=1738132 RepID=A0AAD7FVX1_9AGAR|nr:hypothetical protein FB45DRAFT_352672 [Roridomyces roridus]
MERLGGGGTHGVLISTTEPCLSRLRCCSRYDGVRRMREERSGSTYLDEAPFFAAVLSFSARRVEYPCGLDSLSAAVLDLALHGRQQETTCERRVDVPDSGLPLALHGDRFLVVPVLGGRGAVFHGQQCRESRKEGGTPHTVDVNLGFFVYIRGAGAMVDGQRRKTGRSKFFGSCWSLRLVPSEEVALSAWDWAGTTLALGSVMWVIMRDKWVAEGMNMYDLVWCVLKNMTVPLFVRMPIW